jgi:hypothetical protein
MSKRALDVGAIVYLSSITTATRDGPPAFRIEELLRLEDGITLFKVRSETEPFDRIVAECDLTQHP